MSIFYDLCKGIKEAGRIMRGEEKPARLTVFPPNKTLEEVRNMPSGKNRFLAVRATVDLQKNTLTMELGTRKFVTMPLSKISSGKKLDFVKLGISNGGKTIRFGNQELLVEEILVGLEKGSVIQR